MCCVLCVVHVVFDVCLSGVSDVLRVSVGHFFNVFKVIFLNIYFIHNLTSVIITLEYMSFEFIIRKHHFKDIIHLEHFTL